MSVDKAIRRLREAGASMRCSELQTVMESLGFEVRAGKKQGHKVVTHPMLKDFFGAAYTCGHGKNPEVKPNYVNQMRRLIEERRDQLKRIVEAQE